MQAVLPVKAVLQDDGLCGFTFEFPDSLIAGLDVGASVSVNGVCLTVTHISQNQVSFEAVNETMRVSNLRTTENNSMVNIERSAKRDDEVGGHVVSGHVMGTARISSIESVPNNCRMTFAIPKDFSLTQSILTFVILILDSSPIDKLVAKVPISKPFKIGSLTLIISSASINGISP